jgi:hypothetical protein
MRDDLEAYCKACSRCYGMASLTLRKMRLLLAKNLSQQPSARIDRFRSVWPPAIDELRDAIAHALQASGESLAIVEESSMHLATIYAIDGEQVAFANQAAVMLGEWAFDVEGAADELREADASIREACDELKVFIPSEGIESFANTIDRVGMALDRERVLALRLIDGRDPIDQVVSDASRPEADVHGCIRSLRKCAQDFRDARNHRGEESLRLLRYIRENCDKALRNLWEAGYLRSIPRMEKIGGKGNLEWHYLSRRLIGFCDFVSDPEHGGWWLSPGLIEQKAILVSTEDSEPDYGEEWDVHGFEVLGRYIDGCEVLAEIVEREVASKNDKREVVDSSRPDGLYRAEALLIWGGERYEWLTETMMDALELLVSRFPEKVRPSEMEHKIGRIPQEGFKAIFKVSRIGQPPKHPVEKLVEGRAPAGWYLTK